MFETTEKMCEVRKKLTATAEFLVALSALSSQGGIPSGESLEYLSKVVYDCNSTLKDVIETLRETTTDIIEHVPF